MRLVFLFAGVFLTVSPLGGTESLKINVSPAQAIAPANLRIRVTVQPNAMNRTVGGTEGSVARDRRPGLWP
jgi:hypothetical protein